MSKKKFTSKTTKSRGLVVKRLEGVSKSVFKNYSELITNLVGNSSGVYALYDDTELYYVGKSIDLKRRVKQHLKDKHYASWTHFSFYLLRKEEHISDIESLLIRIANPRGNTAKPKGTSSGVMRKELQRMVKDQQDKERKEMFSGKTGVKKKKVSSKVSKTLVGLVPRKAALYRTYKGKEYNAALLSNGIIKVGAKKFTSPSAAAKSITKRSANGWNFWYIKDSNGDWVKLRDYK
jgi:hypothetical protein